MCGILFISNNFFIRFIPQNGVYPWTLSTVSQLMRVPNVQKRTEVSIYKMLNKQRICLLSTILIFSQSGLPFVIYDRCDVCVYLAKFFFDKLGLETGDCT